MDKPNEPALTTLLHWTGYAAFALGILWAVAIGVGRITQWDRLLELEDKRNKKGRKVAKK